ncbi:MAG: hypothetical protein LBG26_04275 [Treponema sp.]|nr:hypothetical protein [Treponema sp.]
MFFLKDGRKILYAAAIFVSLGACARRGQSAEPRIQDIMAQWTAVERILLTAEFPVSPALAGEIDDFSRSVDRFLDSRIYRMYRYIPFSRDRGAGAFLAPPPPNELEDDQSVKDLVASFREAAVSTWIPALNSKSAWPPAYTANLPAGNGRSSP